MENIKANISIKFTDPKIAETFFKSLQPETINTLTDRSIIHVKKEDDLIQFNIDAKDIIAFRATLNSYLLWMKVLLSISTLINP